MITALIRVGMSKSRMIARGREVAVRLTTVKISSLIYVLHVSVISKCSNLNRVSSWRSWHVKGARHTIMALTLTAHTPSALVGP